jgi:hypothetical protein
MEGMTFARQCKHGRYDAHYAGPGTTGAWCTGGIESQGTAIKMCGFHEPLNPCAGASPDCFIEEVFIIKEET